MRSEMGRGGAAAIEGRGSASEARMTKRRAHGLSKAELRAAGEMAVAQSSKPIVKLPTKLTAMRPLRRVRLGDGRARSAGAGIQVQELRSLAGKCRARAPALRGHGRAP
jgi:hypothetical protein